MNNIEIQKGIVDALFTELNNLDAPGLGGRISTMMDEQPELMGFVFNLDEDFTEDEHTFLIKAVIVIRDVFISAGIPLDIVANESIEQIVEDRVKLYDQFVTEERNDAETWELEANSPVLYALTLHSYPDVEGVSQQMSLVIDVIIGLFEEAAASQQNKDKKNA